MEDSEGPFTCKYCGRVFPKWKSLVVHLKSCPSRRLKTKFDVGQYEFFVIWNPIRRVQSALIRIGKEYGKNNDTASFLAIMKFLKTAGYIDDYSIEKKKAGKEPAPAASSSP